jgi:hypothetical protein
MMKSRGGGPVPVARDGRTGLGGLTLASKFQWSSLQKMLVLHELVCVAKSPVRHVVTELTTRHAVFGTAPLVQE